MNTIRNNKGSYKSRSTLVQSPALANKPDSPADSGEGTTDAAGYITFPRLTAEQVNNPVPGKYGTLPATKEDLAACSEMVRNYLALSGY